MLKRMRAGAAVTAMVWAGAAAASQATAGAEVGVGRIEPWLFTPQPEKEVSPADLATIGEALAPSLVLVEYTLQYDKGTSPGSDTYARWRSASSWGGAPDYASSDWEEFIVEERPAERAGYLVSPTRVVTADPMLHPRFIKQISVRFGDTVVKATPVTYGKERGSLMLDLAGPLPGTQPLAFDAARPGPYLAATYTERDGAWTISVGPSPSRASVRTDTTGPGRRQFGGGEGVITDRSGHPVGLWLGGVSTREDAWKGSPEQWVGYTEAEMARMLAAVEKVASGAVVRVSLGFRSPRSGDSSEMGFDRFMGGGGGEEDITQWHGSGVLVDERTVLVLANFKPKVTGRLERIQVFTPEGEIAGAFEGTLKDYGGFLATLETPANGAARFLARDITGLRDQLLLKAEVTVHGEIRTAYYSRDRIGGYYVGWRRHVFPSVSASSDGYASYADDGHTSSLNFLFTPDGELVGVPIAQREKVAVQERWGSRWGGADQVVPCVYLAEVLQERSANFDAENRPVTEDEENRLAWLGVEMQPMDADLARENNVTDQTRGGASGGMVTYVYPDSPAAKAGIELGDIILRVHVEGQPKPIEVEVMGDMGFGGMMDQFWSSLDQIPSEYLDQLPRPWGTVENPLVRALTDVGFGTAFEAEIFREGKVLPMSFKVEQGPAHYDSAKRFKSEQAGVTVRDLTYEVRRFFQVKDDDPGVIISKVEPGEKGAVAGLKPYELVVSVNDTPVKSAADFEKAIAPGGELRLSVKRMTTGRIVKLKIDPAGEAPDGADAE